MRVREKRGFPSNSHWNQKLPPPRITNSVKSFILKEHIAPNQITVRCGPSRQHCLEKEQQEFARRIERKRRVRQTPEQ